MSHGGHGEDPRARRPPARGAERGAQHALRERLDGPRRPAHLLARAHELPDDAAPARVVDPHGVGRPASVHHERRERYVARVVDDLAGPGVEGEPPRVGDVRGSNYLSVGDVRPVGAVEVHAHEGHVVRRGDNGLGGRRVDCGVRPCPVEEHVLVVPRHEAAVVEVRDVQRARAVDLERGGGADGIGGGAVVRHLERPRRSRGLVPGPHVPRQLEVVVREVRVRHVDDRERPRAVDGDGWPVADGAYAAAVVHLHRRLPGVVGRVVPCVPERPRVVVQVDSVPAATGLSGDVDHAPRVGAEREARGPGNSDHVGRIAGGKGELAGRRGGVDHSEAQIVEVPGHPAVRADVDLDRVVHHLGNGPVVPCPIVIREA